MKMMWVITGIVLILAAAALALFMYLKGKSSGDPESVIGYVQEHRHTDNMALVGIMMKSGLKSMRMYRFLWPARLKLWWQLNMRVRRRREKLTPRKKSI
ncbi:hypothetical protein [Cytobacillus oceanisediminis]|uniref:hypothetical protein n=1 Tax=Cytobacillus oceanisediminis TaxID=665099 RepID=UPI0018DEE774|nr:hypothetical protein [Cytobacillus oceanisediminis]MCM3403500.1 hypothetical protein [Cytobacillus oceanisediminis]MDK7667276.1 hypothetical protein [Cytobacillus oceanisediminis]